MLQALQMLSPKLSQIMSLLQNSTNPIQLLQQMLGNDPRFQMAMQLGNQENPQQIFFNMARERGMNEDEIKQFIGQLGIK